MSESTSWADPLFRLDGQVAVVTGAASGIGAAIAELFVARGARVAVLDLDGVAAASRAEQLGSGSTGVACDVADSSSVRSAVDRVVGAFGAVDVLVNCAGIARLAPAAELTDADWQSSIAVNLTGTFLVSRAVGRVMLEAGRGRIVNIASQAASVAIAEHAAYCASKSGLLGLTRVLALEWGGRGITVNSVSPTVVLTELGRQAWDNPRGDALRAQIPVGRFALPEEVAAAVLFLASGAAAMVNGADLLVDGGYTAH